MESFKELAVKFKNIKIDKEFLTSILVFTVLGALILLLAYRNRDDTTSENKNPKGIEVEDYNEDTFYA